MYIRKTREREQQSTKAFAIANLTRVSLVDDCNCVVVVAVVAAAAAAALAPTRLDDVDANNLRFDAAAL